MTSKIYNVIDDCIILKCVLVGSAGAGKTTFCNASNNILFDVPPHYRSATYRRVGQRGKSSRVLFDPIRHPNPAETLGKLLGEEVSEFVSKKYTPNNK